MSADIPQLSDLEVAVILPCYNEASAIEQVVADFKAALPSAKIYVFDNNSSDDTAEIAKKAGAIVRVERAQGKGNVVRRAFAQVDADIYLMADGDGTYDSTQAQELISLLHEEQLDMVVGVRKHEESEAYRMGHQIGNRMFNLIIQKVLKGDFEDIFSGYRVFSRAYVKSFPSMAQGFETETEMSLHALELQLPVQEVESAYGVRAEGTESKLNTYRDGLRILLYMVRLIKQYRPFMMFGWLALFFCVASLISGLPVVAEYLDTGLVSRFPTAFGAASLMIIASVSFITGLILDGVSHSGREQKRLAYLNVSRYCKK